ncbi:hypothetical protein WJX74_003937 [Apatococcus lobatus]|uniref:DUF676 domain-containing protein n=2 Tax=Apatococcus TaxID=904362 RepID=A0AAW1T987_9CHLO
MLVNGLAGSSANWDTVLERLKELTDPRAVLPVPSEASAGRQTFQGLDTCGQRLAVEIERIVSQQASFKYLSCIGHSMGGLLARYAVGKLYSTTDNTIAGLQPAHFVTMATPHLGVAGQGEHKVPFIKWLDDMPIAGGPVGGLVGSLAGTYANVFMGRTGRHLFLQDGTPEADPLLVRMAEDHPEEGHFLSALRSFASRTCYANASGDHLVGWAASSLRWPSQLPLISGPPGCGVVLQDPLDAGFHPHLRSSSSSPSTPQTGPPEALPAGASVQYARGSSLRSQPGSPPASLSTASPRSIPCTDGRSAATASAASEVGQTWSSDVTGPSGSDWDAGRHNSAAMPDDPAGAQLAMADSGHAAHIMRQLQQLPWRRIDAEFRGSRTPFFAHNHLQVTRRRMNVDGAAVAEHVAKQVAAMEALLPPTCSR